MDLLQFVLAITKVGGQYVLIHVILGSVTTFTSGQSPLRPLAIGIILGLAVSIQRTVQHAPNIPSLLCGLLAMGAWIQVFNSHDILLHSRINYMEHIEWKKERGSIAIEDAVWFALSIPNNFRRLNTKWQIIPVFSFNSDLGKIPSRGIFLLERLQSLSLICCTAVVVFSIYSYLGWIPEQRDMFPLLEKRKCLSWGCLPAQINLYTLFIFTTFLLHKAIYALLSITAVSTHFSSPADWPPFQASAREAWSIRRFWGWVTNMAPFSIIHNR